MAVGVAGWKREKRMLMLLIFSRKAELVAEAVARRA